MEYNTGIRINSEVNCNIVTETIIPRILGSVPANADEISCVDGKLIQTNKTNVGRDKKPYLLQSADITEIITTFSTTIDFAKVPIAAFNNISAPDGTYGKVRLSSGHTEFEGVYADRETALVTNFIFNESFSEINLFIGVTKGTSLTDARLLFIDTEITYELDEPTIKELPEVSTLMLFKDYTFVAIEDGYIKGELANVKLSSTTYYINSISINDNTLIYEVDEIEDITYDGESIKSLGTITEDADAYGVQRWTIAQAVVEANNIDINNILVTYTHSESNGETNLTGSFKNSAAKSHDSLAKSVSTTQNKVDENSEIIDKAMGILGAEKLQDFAVTIAGICTWDNPVGLTRVELFWGTKDISHYNYQQLVNETTKINAGTAETYTLTPVSPSTDYYVVPVVVYTVGGKEYRGIGNVSEFTTLDYIDYYLDGTENIAFTAVSPSTKGASALNLLSSSNNGSSIYSDNTVDLSLRNSLIIKYSTSSSGDLVHTLAVSSTQALGGALASIAIPNSTTETTVTLDVSSVTSGYIVLNADGTGGGTTTSNSIPRIYAE